MNPTLRTPLPLTNHDQVIARARRIGIESGMTTVVVASAEEDDVLAALYRCRQEGIADSILVGGPEKIRTALSSADVPADVFEIVGVKDEAESAETTAKLASEGRAQVVMKGFIKTSILLKTILKKEHGLRDSELVSHSALLYVPRYGKLLNITDGGTVVVPDLAQKLTILANGLKVLRSVGIVKPRVAVLAPQNSVSPALPETGAAAELVLAARDRFGEQLLIDGPMTLERAVSYSALTDTGADADVAGRADMLLVHTLEEGNIIAKSLIQFGGAIFMGVIAGARVPISLVSRSDTMMNKMASVALAVCMTAQDSQEVVS